MKEKKKPKQKKPHPTFLFLHVSAGTTGYFPKMTGISFM